MLGVFKPLRTKFDLSVKAIAIFVIFDNATFTYDSSVEIHRDPAKVNEWRVQHCNLLSHECDQVYPRGTVRFKAYDFYRRTTLKDPPDPICFFYGAPVSLRTPRRARVASL